jgi:predicted enzyme related to lactoylglutathione lyase
MKRPVHFEIHAEDPERAAKFYSDLFGWKTTKWEGPMDYWLVDTGSDEGGINGGIVKRMGPNPDPSEPTPVVGYVCTVGVDNLDVAIARARELGGTEALPKDEIPGMGWLAYHKDTESNIFGMLEPAEDMK